MKLVFSIITLSLLLLAQVPALADKLPGEEKRPTISNKRLKARCVNASKQADLDINNVRARILNGGDMWWDLVGTAKYEIPKVPDGSNEPRRHSLFAGSIWIGGLNNGNIHTAAQTYRQFGGNDLWPGPIDTVSVAVDDTDCDNWDRIFQVTREEIDAFIEEFEANGSVSEIPKNILEWPGNGRADQHEARFLAPYMNVGGGPSYDPAAGDYPDIKGDKALWYVYNDVGNLKTETGSPEIGLEFRTMAFGFATNDEINNMTFYETTIFNRGQKQLDSTYFGQWVDADLGYAFDDYVGCDIKRGLGICYNGDNFDDGAFGYGSNPPSVGMDFFEGPQADKEVVFPGGNGDGRDNDGDGLTDEMDTTYYWWYRAEGYTDMPTIYEGDGIDNNRNGLVDEPNEDIAMSKFVYYDNNFTPYGNPRGENRSDFYNYLIGRWKNGDCISFGGNGNTTASGGCTDFMFPDDPRDANGWNEVNSNNQPNDRRFLQSAGPFTLRPGAVNRVTVGAVWARASSGGNTGSYDLLLLADDKAQKLFNNNFDLLDGPDAPAVASVELDREVVLMMGREDYVATENYLETEISTDGGQVEYAFQGYQLFQLLTSQVTPDQLYNADFARQVWQVDLKDGISRLVNKEYDPEVDESIPSIMVDGADEGIEHVIRITDDAFASGNSKLINHKTYHFLLVAYAAADENSTDEPRQYLAGRRFTQIAVTPRQTDILYDGTKLQAAYGDGPEITRLEGKGNGGIFIKLTEESELKIITDNEFKTPTYQIGHGPVEIKIIDPLKVPVADFELRFIDRDAEGTDGEVLLADIGNLEQTLRARKGEYNTSIGVSNTAKSHLDEAENELKFKEDSLTRVLARLGGSLSTTDSILNAAAKVLLENQISALKADTTQLWVEYREALDDLNLATNRLTKASENLNDSRKKADSVLWVLTKINPNGTRETLRGERGLYTDNEMVISEWGFSIKAGMEYGPLGSSGDQTNGLIGSEVVFEDDAVEWLSALPQSENTNTELAIIYDWIRSGSYLNQDRTALVGIHDVTYSSMGLLDEKGIYKTVANGMMAPYVLTSRSTAQNGFSTFGICQAPSYGLECENFYDLPSIDLVFTSDRSKWSRVLVCEMGEDPNRTEGGANKFEIRQHASLELEPDASGNPRYSSSSKGFSWFPGYAIDVESGERLNIIIGENSLLKQDNAKDMIWNPSSQLADPNVSVIADGGAIVGGMHYIYVIGSKSRFKVGGGNYETTYDGCEQYAKYLDPASGDYTDNRLRGVWSAATWVMPAMLATGYDLKSWKDGLVPTQTRISVRVNRPYQTYATTESPQNGNMPYYTFSTASVAPQFSADFGKEALKNVRVVPNPYYAQSDYEASQIDNLVKLTNLPEECTIKIYTVNGQLVKTFNKGSSGTGYHNTELLWDLKNEAKVPISSGVYIIHIDAPKIGASTTVKFFAVMKPIDLDTF
ncbi:MAG: T9SS type A sorting domain-containing protein [Bacteroidetes bacterium]|nr:T9SS type A sorting domain-containing protein [Bacteroidota bacterium]